MKRVPELRDLSDDHHTSLVIAIRCKRAAREGSERSLDDFWAGVREELTSHLEPHFEIEERHLLPGLEAIGEAGLAARIREDHAALRALRDTDPASRELVGRFGELLEAHVRFEERRVFEEVQHRLPSAVLVEIAAACEGARAGLSRT